MCFICGSPRQVLVAGRSVEKKGFDGILSLAKITDKTRGFFIFRPFTRRRDRIAIHYLCRGKSNVFRPTRFRRAQVDGKNQRFYATAANQKSVRARFSHLSSGRVLKSRDLERERIKMSRASSICRRSATKVRWSAARER